MDRQKLFDSFIEFMGRFAQLKAVAALRDGFIMTTPFTICGSVFLLLDEPEVYGLPPDPRVPTADLPHMFDRASLAAVGMIAGVVLAFFTGRRRR